MTQTQTPQQLTDTIATNLVKSYLTADDNVTFDGFGIATIVWHSATITATTIIRVRLVAGRGFVDFAAITCDSTVVTFEGLGALDDQTNAVFLAAIGR